MIADLHLGSTSAGRISLSQTEMNTRKERGATKLALLPHYQTTAPKVLSTDYFICLRITLTYLILFLTVSFLQCSHFRKLSVLHFQLWYRCVEFWPNAMLTILPLKWKMLRNVHFWPCCVWRGCRAFFKSKIVICRTHVHV